MTNEIEVRSQRELTEVEEDKNVPETIDASGSTGGTGNGVAVNAAGSKITVGVGEVNNARGTGAQITNMQGDINFGNVSAPKARRFDKLPPAPETKQLDNGQELSR